MVRDNNTTSMILLMSLTQEVNLYAGGDMKIHTDLKPMQKGFPLRTRGLYGDSIWLLQEVRIPRTIVKLTTSMMAL